jgi:hypothetical protein
MGREEMSGEEMDRGKMGRGINVGKKMFGEEWPGKN